MLSPAGRLVFTEDDGRTGTTGAVKPEVRLGLWCPSRLVQHLQGCFVCVQDILFEHKFVHPVVKGF